MEQRLLAEVRRECWDMIGGEVAYRFRGGVVAGWHFADELQLPSPPRVERMQIHAMETDYATLRWLPEQVLTAREVGETAVPGVWTGMVTARARVGFRCVVRISDPIEDSTLHVLDEYVDEAHVLVRLEREVLLRWHVVVVDGQEPDLIWADGVPVQPVKRPERAQ